MSITLRCEPEVSNTNRFTPEHDLLLVQRFIDPGDLNPGEKSWANPDSGAVAQLVRVPDCRSGGCGFESRRPRLFFCLKAIVGDSVFPAKTLVFDRVFLYLDLTESLSGISEFSAFSNSRPSIFTNALWGIAIPYNILTQVSSQ